MPHSPLVRVAHLRRGRGPARACARRATRWLRAGKVRDLNDIIWAHMEGTVQRVRPKLMTVSTTLFGLVPRLWSQGAGADVMKRIAAPMVGGLITSSFLTLEIIPVVYTYWRLRQLKRGDLAIPAPPGDQEAGTTTTS